MTMLLWKDWRQVRPLLIAAGILYLMPFVVALVIVTMQDPHDRPQTRSDWLESFAELCVFGLMVATLTTPMFSAVMFARERRDRTGELVACMPIRRGSVVLSKALVSIGATLTPAVVTVALIVALLTLAGDYERFTGPEAQAREALLVIGMISSGVAMSFSLGWLLSAALSNETKAAAIAFLASIMAPTLIATVLWRLDPYNTFRPWVYILILGGTALTSFSAGTVVALRRRTP